MYKYAYISIYIYAHINSMYIYKQTDTQTCRRIRHFVYRDTFCHACESDK